EGASLKRMPSGLGAASAVLGPGGAAGAALGLPRRVLAALRALRLRGLALARLGFALPVGLARVVGDVPAGTLELDGGSGEELLPGLLAGRALGQRLVRELLVQLEVPAFGTLVLVERHETFTSDATS